MPTAGGSACKDMPTAGGSACKDMPTAGGSACKDMPTAGGSACKDMPTLGGSACKDMPTLGGSSRKGSAEERGSASKDMPTSGGSVQQQGQQQGQQGGYVDEKNPSVNKHGEQLVETKHPGVINERNNSYNRDQNNSSKKRIIDLQTFMRYVIPMSNKHSVSVIEIRELFDNLDTDGDGKITCAQLINTIYKINKNFSASEMEDYRKIIKKLCKEIDSNGDGTISYEEFKEFIIKNKLHKK
jgi:calcium-binding protein CML